MDYLLLLKYGVPLLTLGAAWGGAKVALNGTRQRVQVLENGQKELMDRTARMETKIDILVEKH